ncbi:mimitin [Cricetulus griseus]|nr:mimitin [Cricetulus griseus]
MGWWWSVLRSVWSVLSKEVREHVGTDHLGNKYYYIPKYKNWRGESDERLRVTARPGRVALGPSLGCPTFPGLGSCLDRVLQDLPELFGELWEKLCVSVISARLSSEFTFSSGAVAGALALIVAILARAKDPDTPIFSN